MNAWACRCLTLGSWRSYSSNFTASSWSAPPSWQPGSCSMRLSKGYCARYSRAKQKENPFVWTKTADEILACVDLLCWRTLATGHLGDHLEDPLGSKNGQQKSEAGGEQPRAICSELRRPLESAAA